MSTHDPEFRAMSNRIHRMMEADPLLGPCGGTHLVGYGMCQRIALIVRAELADSLDGASNDLIHARALTALLVEAAGGTLKVPYRSAVDDAPDLLVSEDKLAGVLEYRTRRR